MTVITRWSYKRGGRKAGFHCTPQFFALEVLIYHIFYRRTHFSSVHFVSVETKKRVAINYVLQSLTFNERKLQSNFVCGRLVA